MYLLILIGYLLHRHMNSSLGKNLSQYSLIGAWLTMALIALVHSKFEWPKYLSHNPPFTYVSTILLRLSSRRSIKFLPLLSDTLNVTFHLLINLSHSFFYWIPMKTCMEIVGLNWTSWFLYLWPCEATNYLYLGNSKIQENYNHFLWRIAWFP